MKLSMTGAALSVLALAAACITTEAQLAVTANDGKQPLLGTVPTSHTPDNIAVIDLNQSPPKIIGTLDVPNCMFGPPAVVAVAHNGSFALVTNALKFNPDDATKFVLDDTLSVIDLKDPRHPTVVQTLHAGAGATGVSINKQDTLALVAATGGTVSAFSIAGNTLTPVGQVELEAKAQPVDVAISPDGKTALVAERSGNGVVRLAIDGTHLTNTGVVIPTGHQSYGVVFSPDGKFAYNTNTAGMVIAEDFQPPARRAGPFQGSTRLATVTVIDVNSNEVLSMVEVGAGSENLTLSPDGKYLAVTVVNNSSRPGPNYNANGLLKIYRVEGSNLTEVTEAKTGGWGQGAAWNKNHTLILQQSGIDKDIEVYRFDGKSLIRQPTTFKFDSRPGSIATALSR